MELRKLENLDLKNKKVFLRLDLNVPMKNGAIKDDTRIVQSLKTVKYILERTNKLAIASHLGRPDGERKPEYSLEPIGKKLAELLNREVVFVDRYIEEPIMPVLENLKSNQFILLENVRYYPQEQKKDPEFARGIMRGFDVYVNDAFGTVHRADCSVAGAAECVPPEKRAAGFLIQKEIDAFDPIMKHPEAPFTVIMGGAKVSDKIAVILNLLNHCNNLLIGGAMAYTFLKYRGAKVGSSKIEADKMDLVESIYRNAEQRKVRIELPVDHVVGKEFVETTEPVKVDNVNIPDGFMGLDIGNKTAQKYSEIIKNSKTILWNGPMGVFEWKPFAEGTKTIAKAMAESKGKTIVGGGDSVSAVNKAGVADKIFHISTGGGASLELLEGKVLPGLKVLYK